MKPPTITAEQRTAALAKATQVRRERGELTAGVRAGQLTLTDVLARAASGDEIAGRLKVVTLLRALPGWGDKKVAHAMSEIGIHDARRVGGLGAHQKAELLTTTSA
jgi:hypothetical protein